VGIDGVTVGEVVVVMGPLCGHDDGLMFARAGEALLVALTTRGVGIGVGDR
jgi:hypothetical protein